MHVALVHTGVDPYYAAMTHVCALCVTTAVPRSTVSLHTTAEALEVLGQTVKKPFGFSDCQIETPPCQDAVFENRWVKTRLRNRIIGDFVYIDCDVIVRRGFGNILDLVKGHGSDIGLCLDWNDESVKKSRQRAVGENYWDGMRHFNWSVPEDGYCNGGVIAWLDNENSRRLSEKWHELWLQSAATGICRDQPALNHAISLSLARRIILAPQYNAIAHSSVKKFTNPFAVHFFCSLGDHRESLLEDAVNCVLRRGKISLNRIKELVKTNNPYADPKSIRQSLAAGYYLRAATNLMARLRRRSIGLFY